MDAGSAGKDARIKADGYAAMEKGGKLVPFSFERRALGDRDVLVKIRYCGICHSDIHEVRAEWDGASYPLVPGHEIVGEVAAIGRSVGRFKVGDRIGVGCMADSCRECGSCRAGDEQYCERGVTWTYNSEDRHIGGRTFGGYADNIVVDEAFALRISKDADMAATAPLLCAGITTYSPLRHWKVGPGKAVGVVGLGGLGHMAVKLAKSMGARVVVFTTSEGKVEDAKRLGADEAVLSRDASAMGAKAGTLDFIIDTVSARHDIDALLSALKRDGSMVMVGLPTDPHRVGAGSLIFGRRTLSGSLIGGIRETQEMLDYCAAHGIKSDIELIPMQRVNEAYDRAVKGDVRYRFVIDMSSLGKG